MNRDAPILERLRVQYRFFVQETKIYFDTAMDQLGKDTGRY